ncbi:hypothetical protein Ccrd_023444 [Cynara cardunculus var. scolymus]|uniref:EF-hand domain-containing protein n=1 Tax=Cynara cardunculus var. scolymus TaxID=59895 RepID=A0A103XWT4_CYNCS|nr:hypothetical protein Ccrd_023444 [Cynara cardunculus var. scolymus]
MHKGHIIGRNGVQELTLEEFKIWLMTFDVNKDGRISREELREAIRFRGGGRITTLIKGRCGVKSADANRNGFIDYDEIKNLVEFAEKVLHLKIVDAGFQQQNLGVVSRSWTFCR